MNKKNSLRTVDNWINGKICSSTSDTHGPIFDSSTGQQIASVGMSSEADAAEAVSSASIAFHAWSSTPVLKRARVMFNLKSLIERDRQEIASIITREHGKVLHDADGSIQRGLEVVEFACGIPHLIKGDFNEQVGTGVDTYSMRQPMGV